MKSGRTWLMVTAILGAIAGTDALAQSCARSAPTRYSGSSSSCAPISHYNGPSYGPSCPPDRAQKDDGHYRWVQRQVWEWGHWEQRYDSCGRLVQVWNPGGYRTVTVREWVPHRNARSTSHNDRYYARR